VKGQTGKKQALNSPNVTFWQTTSKPFVYVFINLI